ncbi:MAG: sugar phosphate isomerase/epimerase [Oscillospiraceae bacterium]|jgi:sugar phosphate isomerase/epimerase|nr:sugar phosphate isomerase/epimerase [Oscillospiraceae bacterium]
MDIGLQTYTVRTLLRTPAQLDQTFGQLAGMGIRQLELAADYLPQPFSPASARSIAAAANRHGLRILSCQLKYRTAAADPARTAESLRILGARILTNSVIDLRLLRQGSAGAALYGARLNALRDRLLPEGVELIHHNHHYEFLRPDGRPVLEILAETFAGGFALDTYWCQKGGGNILTLLETFAGRVPLLHLRDYQIKPFGLFGGGTDAALGQGNIPFPAVLRAAEQAGVRAGMIEQHTARPLEEIRRSLAHLQTIDHEMGVL